MKKLAFAVVVAAVLAATPAAFPRPATTEPSEVNDVQVLLRDNGIKLSRVKFKRGNQARFLIRNDGTRPYRFKAGFLSTRLLKHGQHQILFAHLGLRGRFPVEQWDARRRISRVYINVV